MNKSRQNLLEHIAKAIATIQNIANDSRTPLIQAIKLVNPLRRLTDCRRELQTHIFILDADDTEYSDTIAKLSKVGGTLKSDLSLRQDHIEFVVLTEDAVAAALRIIVRTMARPPAIMSRRVGSSAY